MEASSQNISKVKYCRENFLKVFAAFFPFGKENSDGIDRNIECVVRQTEIDSANNEKVKSQKYYAWKLLEYAYKSIIGVCPTSITFYKIGKKWSCDSFEFSISHSGDMVVVAVSDKKVGVDVEKNQRQRFNDQLAQKILSKNQQEIYFKERDKQSFLIKAWTEKEAIFKMRDDQLFCPTKIEMNVDEFSQSQNVVSANGEYCLTVVSVLPIKAIFEYCFGSENLIF